MHLWRAMQVMPFRTSSDLKIFVISEEVVDEKNSRFSNYKRRRAFSGARSIGVRRVNSFGLDLNRQKITCLLVN